MSICCGNYSNVHVPHDRMYLFGNCCRMAHLMSNTHELPEVGLQRLRTHIALQFVPHVLCAGHWSVRRLFVTSITCVLLAAWRGVLSFVNIITRLKRIWGKRTRPMTSFRCHKAFMFPWMRTLICVCVHGSVCVRSGMLIVAILNVFSYKTIHEEYFPTKKRQQPCRARGARAHSYFRTYRSAQMVLYIKNMYYISVNR